MHMRPFLAWLMLLALTGCASSTPMQFYLLSADSEPVAAALEPLNPTLVVGVGPIHLPAYLDRPQRVVAVTEHQVRLDEQQRWAERLDQSISRSLTALLSQQLGLNQVVQHPWGQRQAMDYQVAIDIVQFHQGLAGHNRLAAQWQIVRQGQTLSSQPFDCDVVAADDAAASVKAQSQCLGRLGGVIASRIRQLASQP